MDEESLFFLFFFFQAEDGIRYYKVTEVQTCALPISNPSERWKWDFMYQDMPPVKGHSVQTEGMPADGRRAIALTRSEERRVGKECRARVSTHAEQKKKQNAKYNATEEELCMGRRISE